jgi:hypothetical protein
MLDEEERSYSGWAAQPVAALPAGPQREQRGRQLAGDEEVQAQAWVARRRRRRCCCSSCSCRCSCRRCHAWSHELISAELTPRLAVLPKSLPSISAVWRWALQQQGPVWGSQDQTGAQLGRCSGVPPCLASRPPNAGSLALAAQAHVAEQQGSAC